MNRIELENTFGNAADSQNNLQSSELLEREQIERTPFWIIGNKEEGYFLTMGKYRLTDTGCSKEDIYEMLHANDKWDLILKMILCVIGDKEVNELAKK